MHRKHVLEKISFCYLFSIFIFTNTLSAIPTFGLYFSPVSFTENGFLILGVEISKKKQGASFLSQELRYHQEKGWEEVIFAGEVEETENVLLLKPNSCQIRASREFGVKKGLVRRFDCLHLSFTLEKESDGMFQLSSSLLGTISNVPFPIWIPDISEEPVAISFLLPGPKEEEAIWGFHMNGIGKNPPIRIWNQKQNKWDPFRAFVTPRTKDSYQIYLWKRSFSD